jgi:chromosome segregation ATPase
VQENEQQLRLLSSQVIEWRARAQQYAADLEMTVAFNRQLEKRLQKQQSGVLREDSYGADLIIQQLRAEVGRLEQQLDDKIQCIVRLQVEKEETGHRLIIKDSDLDRLNRRLLELESRWKDAESRFQDAHRTASQYRAKIDDRNRILQAAMRMLTPQQLDELKLVMRMGSSSVSETSSVAGDTSHLH